MTADRHNPRSRPKRSEAELITSSILQGIAVFAVLVLGIGGCNLARDAWRDYSAKRPDNILLGRWERTSASGVRHTAVFHGDGVAEFDGQAKDLDFMRHVRYKLIDGHTLVLYLTDISIKAVKEHYPDVRDVRRVVKVGDEISRVSVSFPSAKEMVVMPVSGEKETWRKAN